MYSTGIAQRAERESWHKTVSARDIQVAPDKKRKKENAIHL